MPGPFQQVSDRVGEFFLGRTGPGPAGVIPGQLTERRGDAVRELARANGWARIDVLDDIFGRPRYALAFAHPREA